jgi:hypothetical protein
MKTGQDLEKEKTDKKKIVSDRERKKDMTDERVWEIRRERGGKRRRE